ncbi:MAG: hypothetical protein ACQSGP_25805, partial [Frankia sp.]
TRRGGRPVLGAVRRGGGTPLLPLTLLLAPPHLTAGVLAQLLDPASLLAKLPGTAVLIPAGLVAWRLVHRSGYGRVTIRAALVADRIRSGQVRGGPGLGRLSPTIPSPTGCTRGGLGRTRPIKTGRATCRSAGIGGTAGGHRWARILRPGLLGGRLLTFLPAGFLPAGLVTAGLVPAGFLTGRVRTSLRTSAPIPASVRR